MLFLYVALAISLVISLLLHGAKPSKTLGWLLAIFTHPRWWYLIVLGRNRRRQKLHDPKENSDKGTPYPSELVENLSEEHKKLTKLIWNSTSHPPTQNNTLFILKDGIETFESIFEALESAEHFIHFQYYIFEEGQLADRLFQLFKKKKAKGVQIRLIYDGIGSYSLSKKYLKKLKSIGVKVYPFLPFTLLSKNNVFFFQSRNNKFDIIIN